MLQHKNARITENAGIGLIGKTMHDVTDGARAGYGLGIVGLRRWRGLRMYNMAVKIRKISKLVKLVQPAVRF